MKTVVFNKHNLLDKDIQIKENRAKLIIRNSRNQVLLCKINGVYHFVGGRIEQGETIKECAIREAREETGIELDDNSLITFLQLKQYVGNYYNSGKNCLSTITYVEAKTDKEISYDERSLDVEESKKDFQLVYIHIDDVMDELENNRETARNDGREFIIDEMKYIIMEYKNQLYAKKFPDEER